jgi:phosphoribosylanthranilate isomerase
VKVKVCCIASVAEARLAIDAGAAALGLVSAMPSGPGVIDEATIAEVASAVAAAGVETFLLTAHTDAAAIVAQHRRCRTTTLQLVDTLAPRELRALRRALPGVKLVQVVHVTGPASLDEALAVAPFVDALLLDSGNPALAVKQLGGTGRTHDWAVSRAIRDQVGVPLWLAGGLHAGNVHQAIAAVQPHGLDLCSSVRSQGALDAAKLRAFFETVNATPTRTSP